MKVIAIQYNIVDKCVVLRKYGSDNSILDVKPLSVEQVEMLEEAIDITLADPTINLSFKATEVIEFLEELGGQDDLIAWVNQ